MPRKTKVSAEEYKIIEDQSRVASEILDDDRFQFIREYFQNALDYVEQSILNNHIKDVDEIIPITDKVTHIFKTKKKVQIDELVGQYKFIKKFFVDLDYYARLKKELDEQVADKRFY